MYRRDPGCVDDVDVSRPGPFAAFPARFAGLDRRIDGWWDHLRGNPTVDRLFYTASEVGDFGVLWLAIGATAAAISPQREAVRFARLAGALAAESIIVNGGLKSLFRRDRPDWEQDRPHALRKPRTSSFPSGHASSAVTAALLLSEGDSQWAPVYWVLAAVVATSRVHVKIHHGSDVAGGLIVGAAIGTLVRRLIPLT